MKSKKETIVMKNALARAQHQLKLAEKRIISIALTKINSTASKLNYKNKQPRTIKISAREYQKTAGLKNKRDAYKDMITTAETLMKKQLTIKENTMTGTKKTVINWVAAVEYETGRGEVKITFTNSIMPYLCAIENRFTAYKLEEAEGIKSIYTWRILEFLTSWSKEKEGCRKIALKDFSEMIETPPSHKNADVLQKIIEPAITELEKRGWTINYEKIKTGREITHITFSWRKP
ncbi:replication initiation protein [Thiolapillus sp.]|uniref:replication initiation protein n=4 Tax=Thiolapillus sp. TaxID=2017437 RepID=UPI003AF6725D